MVLTTACDNYDDIVPEKYNKIVSLKEYGEVNMTLYSTGLPTEHSITILKGGADPMLEAHVKLSGMNDVQFSDYLEETGHSYLRLPDECYYFAETDFDFGPDERYKVTKVYIDADKVAPLIENQTDEETYVIPLILTSENDSILSTANNLIFKIEEVVVPSVSFSSNTTTGGYTKELSSEGGIVSIPLKMQIDNQWDFDVRVEVDPATTNLTSSAYTLLNDGKVSFDAASSTAYLQVQMNGLEHIIGKLGLKITAVEGMAFDYDKDAFQLTVKKEKYPLTIDNLYTNAQEPSEGPLANILDGSVSTFFHTAWSVSVSGSHYVEVTLPTAFKRFVFEYTNRQANGNAALANFNVLAGPDKNNLTQLRNFTTDADGLPTGGAGSYTSPEMVLSDYGLADAKVIRFVCVKNYTNGIFWVWSTFTLRVL